MTSAETRFQEAAAFFALFVRSAWKTCHVRTGEMEIFVARDRDTPNPLMGEAPIAVAQPVTQLRAPHLGTLVALADVGTMLAPGQPYARLELLGEEIELLAETGGAVADHCLAVGTLAEYDQPLLGLCAA